MRFHPIRSDAFYLALVYLTLAAVPTVALAANSVFG
jgi:hypothetical protein